MRNSKTLESLDGKSDWRQQLPTQILALLPFTLFFQVGLMYAGLIFFLLAWALSGDWRNKLARIQSSALLLPVVCLSLLSIIISTLHPHPAGEFAAAFSHYQTY